MNCTVSTITSDMLNARPTHAVMSEGIQNHPDEHRLDRQHDVPLHDLDAAEQARRVGRRDFKQHRQPLQPLLTAGSHVN